MSDPENVGSIMRLCVAFGAGGLVLGPGCAAPFSRRVLRVSMGTAFRLPIVESEDLARDAARLQSEFAVEAVAAVLDKLAEPLQRAAPGPRVMLLFGNEKHGLQPETVASCRRKVTLPMLQMPSLRWEKNVRPPKRSCSRCFSRAIVSGSTGVPSL